MKSAHQDLAAGINEFEGPRAFRGARYFFASLRYDKGESVHLPRRVLFIRGSHFLVW